MNQDPVQARMEEITKRMTGPGVGPVVKEDFAWILKMLSQYAEALNEAHRIIDAEDFGNEYAVVCHFKAENARLRAVADAARAAYCPCHMCGDAALTAALSDLDAFEKERER